MKNRNYNQDLPIKAAFKKPARGAFANDAEAAKWTIATVKDMNSGGNPEAWKGDLSSRVLQRSCFMVASTAIGADEMRIAAMFGIDPKLAGEWGQNLRKNGLWLDDGTVVYDQWLHPQNGFANFLIDTMVAEGHLRRLIDPVKGPIYQADLWRNMNEVN